MMNIQTRRRNLNFPFFSFLTNSFLFFSLHFPLNLNCQTNWKRKKPNHSDDLISGASSPSTPPHVRDYEGGDEQQTGNDYAVFLSFRGKDTRKGFTDHLYTSLVNAGIHVFRDDNELRVGEKIDQALLCSIMQSKISIPIISENYASSKWCLRELTQMLKCKKREGQILLPIFYKVEPSQVRHLTGRLGDAINAHKKNLDEMVVKEWEEALKEVSSIKGWESEKIGNGHEAILVKTVVRRVITELKRLFQLHVPKQLVGIDDRVEHIMSKIDAKFNGTWIIGIYGMGGIGKTTLAKVLYNRLSSHFEDRSFVANIQETSQREGIKCLQKQLIFDIIGSSCDVSNVDDGISVLNFQFASKKVLILLDDIDDNTHLNVLVGDGSWFKGGSIVIITTRNKGILDKARASHTYQLNELPSDQSLILFSRHAFRKDYPPSDYNVISHAVVSITGGLPLALEIISSFLCGKTMEAWKDTSKKLKKVPDKKVQETLKISYDTLDFEEQQIFLDIACFFNGSPKQSATYMWDACGFFPGKGIEVLSLMSLIKITEDGKLTMHDQLRDLGREIVRLENLKKPQKRSRLWDYEDAVDVLVSNKGTNKIEAVCLNEYTGENRFLVRGYTGVQFKELTNLRFLRVDRANFIGDFQDLLPQLRWLDWRNCPLDFGAVNFLPKKLLILDLTYNEISEDWRGWDSFKMATKLKVLNLTGCRSLRRTPDLSAFKKLEILILEDCWELEEIHPSIGDIKTLISLNVNKCERLEELPAGVGRMENLVELLLNKTAIREIPMSEGGLMKLETLCASGCRRLKKLSIGVGRMEKLRKFFFDDTNIQEIPILRDSQMKLETLHVSSCGQPAQLEGSMSSLVSLTQLDLSNCVSLTCLPNSIGHLASLKRLLLQKCHLLREIPDSIGQLASLSELDLKWTAIEELPESIGSLKVLRILDASYCASLACIPSSIGHIESLNCLLLRECHSLRVIPDLIGKLESLIELDLSYTAIEELSKSIDSLKALKTLDASNCVSLSYISSSIGQLTSLQCLLLQGCRSLTEIPDSLRKLTLVTELSLYWTAIKELPESIGSLKNLKTLDASNCASLAHIPSSIGHLASLQCLLLRNCHSLREIPYSIGKLISLTKLDVIRTSIEELPESIGSLKKLKTLDASYCASLACIPNSIGDLESLNWLLLRECHSLREIPNSIGKLTSLIMLDLNSTAIEELPESIGSLKILTTLDASYCASLAHIPSSIGLLESLQHLLLRKCPSLREIPNSIGKLASLIELDLKWTAIEELPEFIGTLKRLQTLDASCCASLARIPSSIGHLASLRHLLLRECHSLRNIPDSIGKLASLTELDVKWTAIEELPESIGFLKELKNLDASYCTSLTHITNSIGHLASLQFLFLRGCHSLREIPNSIGKLASLNELDLNWTAIVEFPESIGNLQNLRILGIRGNYLTELPSAIGLREGLLA